MSRYDKYLSVCNKLRNRYYENGRVVVSVGGKPTNYRRYLDMAAVKYLGCDPDKLKGTENG